MTVRDLEADDRARRRDGDRRRAFDGARGGCARSCETGGPARGAQMGSAHSEVHCREERGHCRAFGEARIAPRLDGGHGGGQGAPRGAAARRDDRARCVTPSSRRRWAVCTATSRWRRSAWRGVRSIRTRLVKSSWNVFVGAILSGARFGSLPVLCACSLVCGQTSTLPRARTSGAVRWTACGGRGRAVGAGVRRARARERRIGGGADCTRARSLSVRNDIAARRKRTTFSFMRKPKQLALFAPAELAKLSPTAHGGDSRQRS